MESLLQVVTLRPLIIEDGKGGLGWFCAAVAGSDDGVVIGVVFPHAAFPSEGELVRKRRLRAVAQRTVVAGGDGHEFVWLAVGGDDD